MDSLIYSSVRHQSCIPIESVSPNCRFSREQGKRTSANQPMGFVSPFIGDSNADAKPSASDPSRSLAYSDALPTHHSQWVERVRPARLVDVVGFSSFRELKFHIREKTLDVRQ